MDEAGQSVEQEQPGEIEVRGATVFSEYWRRPAETAAAPNVSMAPDAIPTPGVIAMPEAIAPPPPPHDPDTAQDPLMRTLNGVAWTTRFLRRKVSTPTPARNIFSRSPAHSTFPADPRWTSRNWSTRSKKPTVGLGASELGFVYLPTF